MAHNTKKRSPMKRKMPAWSMYDSHAACSYPWQPFHLLLLPDRRWRHQARHQVIMIRLTIMDLKLVGAWPRKYVLRGILLQLLDLAFAPPPACRIRTVRAVIWMCSPVQINLCVRLLRSSVQIKLLRYPQRSILEMLQTLPSSPQLPSALPSSP